MKLRLSSVLTCCVVLHVPAVASGQTAVSSSQINGTWRNQHSTFKVWTLGSQKLRVEFSGVRPYVSQAGPMANTGEGSGIAVVDGDTAVFKPDGVEEECRIVMKFASGELAVTQEGVCGFGNGVTAAGTYRKVSSRRPKFSASRRLTPTASPTSEASPPAAARTGRAAPDPPRSRGR